MTAEDAVILVIGLVTLPLVPSLVRLQHEFVRSRERPDSLVPWFLFRHDAWNRLGWTLFSLGWIAIGLTLIFAG